MESQKQGQEMIPWAKLPNVICPKKGLIGLMEVGRGIVHMRSMLFFFSSDALDHGK